MKNKNMSQRCEPEKANTNVGHSKKVYTSEKESQKEILEKDIALITPGNKTIESNENKVEKTKVDRPFRSRLPKLKMFIPRRPKSRSRSRNEDTKPKVRTGHMQTYSPKPSPRTNRKMASETKQKQSPKSFHRKMENIDIHKPHIRNSPRVSPKLSTRSPIQRGACASSPVNARRKSPNPNNITLEQTKTSRTDAIIEAVLAPSPALSPLMTQKQQKDHENEQEKLRIINDILTANLPGASASVPKNVASYKSNTFNRPSKIPIYQNSHVPNRNPMEVS